MFIELQLYCGLIERILIIYSHASLSLYLCFLRKKIMDLWIIVRFHVKTLVNSLFNHAIIKQN